MAAYSFNRQFVAPIQAGTKRHTIRGDRKDGRIPRKGEPLYLFCGMRTKNCFRILPTPPLCKRVQRIHISDDFDGAVLPKVTVDDEVLDRSECEMLAQADGFPNFIAMMRFWRGNLPFDGNIIHWK
jgi:hypothetical protein